MREIELSDEVKKDIGRELVTFVEAVHRVTTEHDLPFEQARGCILYAVESLKYSITMADIAMIVGDN